MAELLPERFLANISPFDRLPAEALQKIGATLSSRTYAADTVIYQQDRSELNELSLIESGEVEKYFLDSDGRRRFGESFGAGETFGAISILLNNQTAIRSVRAVSETRLYHLDAEQFIQLCQQYPSFYDYYTYQFGKRMLDGGYAAMLMRHPKRESGFQVSDRTFTQQVRQYYTPTVSSCTPDTSIREAAKSMTYFRQNYILVLSPERAPIGILTDQDLREQVIAQGRDVDEPVSRIMGRPVLDIQADAYSYEAILLMFRHKIDFLAVREGEQFLGMVSLEQLLHAPAKSPFIFIQKIAYDEGAESLRKRWAAVPDIIDLLIDRGTRPETINQVVSVIADAITHNVIRHAIAGLGPPPARFVFTTLGSEGRKEQTLKTDQDNALIYEDVPTEKREGVRAYFLQLGEQVCDELDAIGFSYCEGNLMAKNPKWNHSLSHWKSNYTRWVQEPATDNALSGSTFFDCRAIYGDFALLDELRAHIFSTLEQGATAFFMGLSRVALLNRPPLTLFGGFQLTEQEDKSKTLNIKRASQAISDLARIYALQHHIVATHTGERLHQLTVKGVFTEEELNELLQSYYFMMRLRLSHQVGQLQAGKRPDNLLLPEELSKIERVTLKEVFKVIEKYQKRLSITFSGSLS